MCDKSNPKNNNYADYCNFLKDQPHCNFGKDNQDNFMCVTYSSTFFQNVLKKDFKAFILERLLKYINYEFKIDSFDVIYNNLSVSACLDDPKKIMIYILHHCLEKHSREPYSVTMGLIEDYLKEKQIGVTI